MFSILGFLEGTSFCFSFKIFLFGFISCTLSFSYCYYWFIFYEKKNNWLIMNFPGESPSAASLWYTIYLVYQVLTAIYYTTEVSGNCLMSSPQTWDCTYELGISVSSRYMGASAELHACGWAQSGFGPADFSKITSTLISELKLLPCSLSCVVSALPVPFSRALNLPTLPLVYLIKITF